MSIKKKSAKAKENKIADQPGLSRLFTPVSNSINLSNVLNRTLWVFLFIILHITSELNRRSN